MFVINPNVGTIIRLNGPENSIVFTATEEGWQRTEAEGLMQLPKGVSEISLQVANEGQTIDIKAIELINFEERVNIENG